MTATKRAAWYGRRSTDQQADNTSMDDQREICEATIRARGWELVDAYIDDGMSGTDANRPEWRRMLEDARAKKIDAIVVAKLDRFARKAHDAIRETDRLAELGVDLVVVKEQIDMSTPAGRAMRTMLAGFAEFERDTIVARTAAGQRAAARMGRWPGGQPPFGWRLEGLKKDARPMRDEREWEVARLAHTVLVKQRKSAGELAAHLNEIGAHPRGGASRQGQGMRWEHATVRQVFSNPALWTGEYHWGRADGRQKTAKSHHTKVDPKTGLPFYGATVVVQLPDPPFTKAEFDAIQRAFRRRTGPTEMAAPQTQLLGSRITGRCGKHYNGVSLAAGGAYRCSGRRYKSIGDTFRCSCSQFAAHWIDEFVWSELRALLSAPARIEAMARAYHGLDREDSADSATLHLRGLDAQIIKLERAEGRLIEDVLFADKPDKQRERLVTLRSELVALREQRATVEALRTDRAATARALLSLAEIAERMRGRLQTMPAADKRRVVELLDLRVEVTAWESHGHGEHPVAVSITGRLDPRLFGDGDSLAVAPDRPTPDTPQHTKSGERSSPSCSSSSRSRWRSPSSPRRSCSISVREPRDARGRAPACHSRRWMRPAAVGRKPHAPS